MNFVPSRVSRAPAAVLLAFLVSAGIAHCGASAVTQAASKELFSIQGNDLPGNFNGIGIQDVAISPDNKRIVVEFKVGEGQGALGTWLGEWEIATKKLLNQARIEGPVQGEAPSHPRFLRRLQFSADGSEIVAIAGRQLYLIDAASLELLFSVSALNAEGRPDPNVFVRSFAISGDGNVLAVLSGPPPLERGYDLVRLLKLKTGEEISRWPLSERSRSISLSMSGEYMLVTLWDPTTPRDILLLDSSTGKKTETFESGFGYGSGYGAWDALFVVPNRFVATPGFGTDQKGRYSGYALRVFDAQAGRVTQELTYEHFGPTAVIAVSNRAPVIVMLNLWMDPKAIKRSDRHVFHRVAQLLFFRLSENQPLCVLDPLPEGDIRMSRSGFLRFSPDLSLFVVLTGSKLTVYTVSNCGSPVPAEVKSITSPSNAASVR